MKKAVVLLSGGLDSATVLAMAKDQGYDVHTISFDYGQRHRLELDASATLALMYQASHTVIPIDLRTFGGSALTDNNIDVPKDSYNEANIPITYVPARNTIFLSLALAYAETLKAFDIFIGANAVDYSGYPDCRPEYIDAFERMANLALAATAGGKQTLRVHAPLIHMSKAQIIQAGSKLGVDYTYTNSCYDPTEDGFACGHCDSCILRKKGFAAAGIPDPTRYAKDA